MAEADDAHRRNQQADEERRRHERRQAQARREQERQRKERERGRKHNEKSRHFHEGMAQLRGETRDRGWQHERTSQTSLGGRRHDTARPGRDGRTREFSEYKGGRNIGADALLQLAKDWEILQNNPNARGTWIFRENARLDPRVRDQLDRMRERFGDRFQIERASRERGREADRLGRQLERERNSGQGELYDVQLLRKQQREKERADRLRQRVETQEAAAKAIKAREAELERTRVREREEAIEARERKLRDQMPNAPDDVIRTLARSTPLPNDPKVRKAHERLHTDRHDAETRNRDRGRDGRERGR